MIVDMTVSAMEERISKAEKKSNVHAWSFVTAEISKIKELSDSIAPAFSEFYETLDCTFTSNVNDGIIVSMDWHPSGTFDTTWHHYFVQID